MSEFEKYIEAKYPNRSPKILFQKFKDIDGTLFYGVKEIEDQAEVWSHQQAKIDHFKTMNQRYIGKMQEQQDQIAELKNQLACCREENKALLAVNNSIERECNHISSNTVVVK